MENEVFVMLLSFALGGDVDYLACTDSASHSAPPLHPDLTGTVSRNDDGHHGHSS
jgi:hypothetical protein